MGKQIVIRPEEADPQNAFNKDGRIKRAFYEEEITKLQVELVKLQNWIKAQNKKIIVIMEGRDGAGKGGTIKALTEHMNPRGCRVVALQKPSDIEVTQWYFQRYISNFPNGGEMVFYDRSWYNRAGVERVMNFCTNDQYKEFIYQVPNLEQMLLGSGILLFKYFLDVGQEEQLRRIQRRKTDPLRMWKLSPIDERSINLWDNYTEAFHKMFSRTHTPYAPWVIVNSNDKKRARLNLARDLLSRIDYEGKDQSSVCLLADPEITTRYSQGYNVKSSKKDKEDKDKEKKAEKKKKQSEETPNS